MKKQVEAVEIIGRIEAIPTILETVCRITGMGFAAVAKVTESEWTACAVRDEIDFGLLPGGDLKLETTICNEIRQSRQAVIISDTAEDPAYRDHHTPRIYGFRSYVSVPVILANGQMWGTLCAIDPHPRLLDRPEVRNIFAMFADLIGFHLNMAGLLDASENDLSAERATGIQREQFIAVLGHDLRNPLASVRAGITMMRRRPDEPRATTILDRMQSSVLRMEHLVEDILDFSRGRMGSGIALDLAETQVPSLIGHVIDELAAHHPHRELIVEEHADAPVLCDPERLAQLVSNLLGNAVTHGAADEPVTITCATDERSLRIDVANGGKEISEDARAALFQPFVRGGQSGARDGIGLGLYIAQTIAKAHGGNIDVTSSAGKTCFSFTMPLRPN